MAKHRRSGRFPRRAMLWIPFDVSIALVSGSSPVSGGNLLAAYFSQTGEEVPIGATIGPVRGKWAVSPAVATTFATAASMKALLQLNKEGGRTQTANPDNDILDAMWYGQMFTTSPASEVSAGVFNQFATEREFHTKAMRKITGNGQELIPTAITDTNADYNVRFVGNLMIRLP